MAQPVQGAAVAPTDRPTLQEVQSLMRLLFMVHPLWCGVIAVASLLSMFSVTHSADGATAVDFRLTNTTALVIAILWLPAILRIVTLAGVGMKVAGMEATTPGIGELLKSLSADSQQQVLPPLIAALQVSRTESGQAQPGAAAFQQELERHLAELPLDAQTVRGELEALAKEYERLRAELPSGRTRTLRMTEIVVRARALAVKARLTPGEIRQRFLTDEEGQRIVAVALADALRDPALLDVVLKAIDHSKSAFEQYSALAAAADMLDLLDAEQGQKLAETIRGQMTTIPSPVKHIQRGTDRWPLATRILSRLDANAIRPSAG